MDTKTQTTPEAMIETLAVALKYVIDAAERQGNAHEVLGLAHARIALDQLEKYEATR